MVGGEGRGSCGGGRVVEVEGRGDHGEGGQKGKGGELCTVNTTTFSSRLN